MLQTRRYSESSKIVTLYTREYGKMGVMARGALQPRSKFGSVLQPMAFLSTVIYRKEGRDLQNISGAETVERFQTIMSSLERMSTGMAIVEIVNASMHDEDPNPPLFDSLVAALNALNDPASNEASVHLWFLMRLARILGYTVGTDQCGVCQEPFVGTRETIPYSIPIGAPLCREHQDSVASRSLSRGAFHLMCAIGSVDAPQAATAQPSSGVVAEAHEALAAFIRYHVDGLRRLRVSNVSAKVLDVSMKR